jgi:hypothetical protein
MTIVEEPLPAGVPRGGSPVIFKIGWAESATINVANASQSGNGLAVGDIDGYRPARRDGCGLRRTLARGVLSIGWTCNERLPDHQGGSYDCLPKRSPLTAAHCHTPEVQARSQRADQGRADSSCDLMSIIQ